ncbi:MAG TPA: GerMN domain-containing protein [Acidimicrobiales bacterium]|nr:GerMN domain-containing protein [Acidimicrobiales bacterium]
MRPRRRRVLASALLAVVAGGCGVPHDDSPRALSPEGVPFSLLATSTTTTRPSPPPVVEELVPIYLVDNQSRLLVEVLRPVPAPASVPRAIEELLEGPNDDELARGLSSSLASSTELLAVEGPAGGVVTIDLSDLSGIAGEGQRMALAQVVFTATAAPDVDAVLFKFDGQPSEAPNAQGESTAEPLGRDDFAAFDPTAPSTTAPPEG